MNNSFARDVLWWLRAWLLRVLVAIYHSKAARVFFAVWILILTVAPLREIALTTFKSDHSFGDVFDTDHDNFEETNDSVLSLPLNDAIARLETSQEPAQAAKLYRDLLKRHPKNAMLIARFLDMSLVNSWIDRRPFYLPQPTFPASAPGVNAPPAYVISPNADDIKRFNDLISVAQRGQKLDSQNAFFDAIIVRCCVELKRDKEAYRVLANSRHKKFYESYAMDVVRAIGNSALQRQPFAVEYRSILGTDEYWTRRFDFGNDLLLSEMWHREKQKIARRAADSNTFKLLSLQRRADIERLLAKILFSRDRNVQIDVHQPLVSLWRYDFRLNAAQISRGQVKDNRRWSRHFANQATALGSPRIAQQTLQLADTVEQLYKFSSVTTGDDNFSFQKLRALSSLQGIVLGQIAFFALLFIFLSWFLARTEKALILKRIAAKSAFTGAAFGAVFLSLAFFLVFTEQSETYGFKGILLSGICIVGTLLAPFFVIWIWHVLVKEKRANFKTSFFEYSKLPPLRKLLDFMAFSAVVQLWICAAVHFVCDARGIRNLKLPILNETFYASNENGWWCFALGFPTLFLYCLVVWRWPVAAPHRAFSHARLRSLRAACGLSITLGSVLFLLCVLASVPLRHNAARQFDEYLKHDGLWLATGQDSAQWIAKLQP